MKPAVIREGDELRVYLQVTGAAVPAWIAAAVAVSLLLATLGFLLALFLLQDLRADHRKAEQELRDSIDAAAKEIRILQLHTMDLESVMIRSGMAARDELAEWQPSKGPRARPPSRETEPAEPEEEK